MPLHQGRTAQHQRHDITTGKTLHQARLYDPLAALFMLGRGRALRERTIALAHVAPGDRVLEVGCGTGEVALRARTRSGPTGSVAGIDASSEMIAVARQKAARANLDIDLRIAAVEALPFADATFDVVLSSLMMHHLPEDLKPRALAEMRRVLAPGGRLLVVDFQRPKSRLARLSPVWLVHRRLPSGVQELPTLLERAGFAAVASGDTGFGYLGFVHGRVGL
ncbi:MAG: methyltransferase domain-containing protein [Chloroflexia bacterium]|nr:methyltransferase domain-containing protein [Chloroflexia bacterium]